MLKRLIECCPGNSGQKKSLVSLFYGISTFRGYSEAKSSVHKYKDLRSKERPRAGRGTRPFLSRV